MDKTISLEGTFLRSVVDVPHTSLRIFVLSVTLLCSSIYFYFSHKVKIAPGVPIVGIAPGESIDEARRRFVKDAQNMLLEGHSQVHAPDNIPH